MRDTFVKTLSELAETNPKIMLLTGDLGFGVLDDFSKRFPKQFLNVGVAEQNMTGVATGLALEGKVVFTYSIANFPTLRCLEQIRNDACYHQANVKIVAVGGGFSYGSLGMSHHATEDLAILRSFPMTILSPCDLYEAEEATRALIDLPGTAYLRIDKSCAKIERLHEASFEIGKARMLQDGADCTLIAAGGVLQEALIAANALDLEGIRCRILSMHTIKPIDRDAIFKASSETGGIVTIEEHTIDGGLGSAVAEVCLEQSVRPKFFHRIGLRAGFSAVVGGQQYLREYYQIDSKTIFNKIKKAIKVPNMEAIG